MRRKDVVAAVYLQELMGDEAYVILDKLDTNPDTGNETEEVHQTLLVVPFLHLYLDVRQLALKKLLEELHYSLSLILRI